MPILNSRKSYAETVEGRRRFLTRLGVLLLVFVAFEVVVGLFLATFSVSSSAMEPTLARRDYVLATPLVYGPSTFLGKIPAPVKPSRGDIVLVEPPYGRRPSFFRALADSFVRFVTLQRISLMRGPEATLLGPFAARVIGMPGDTVEMDDFVFKVQAAGTDHFLTEFELSHDRYDIQKPNLPQGWSDEWPLSGKMPARTLGKDEYFVAGDNRAVASDSRSWGPVGIAHFKAKILLRYWPFSHFGIP